MNFRLKPITITNSPRKGIEINKIFRKNEIEKEKEKSFILPSLSNKRKINDHNRLLKEDNSSLKMPIINNSKYKKNNNIYYKLRKIQDEDSKLISDKNHFYLNFSLDLPKKMNIGIRERNISEIIYSNSTKKKDSYNQNLNSNSGKKDEYKINNINNHIIYKNINNNIKNNINDNIKNNIINNNINSNIINNKISNNINNNLNNNNEKSKFRIIWENALIKRQNDEKINLLEKFKKKEKQEQLEVEKKTELEKVIMERKKPIENLPPIICQEDRLKRQKVKSITKRREEKIMSLVEESKMKIIQEKELELKEKNLDNKSKHENILNILNKLVKQYLEIYKTDNLKEILELINEIGKVFQKDIDYDIEFSKDNVMTIQEAVKDENISIKFLGIMGEDLLIHCGVNSIIEKNSKNDDFMDGVFKIFLSDYLKLKKFEIKINSNEVKSNILKNPKELFEFIDTFKEKIMNEYDIPSSKIYIISYRIDLCEFTLIFLDKDISNVVNWKKYKILFNVDINKKPLLESIKLFLNFFENQFNKEPNSWKNESLKRGGENYYPPSGWMGISLKVVNLFDNGDNTWLGSEGKNGEWAVAYHGIGKGNEVEKLKNIILNNLKAGPHQRYKNSENSRDKEKNPIDKGVYLGKNIKVAKKYANLIKLGKQKKFYRLVVMCRVNPEKIRQPIEEPLYWIVDDNYDCVRPYRILLKECKKKPYTIIM